MQVLFIYIVVIVISVETAVGVVRPELRVFSVSGDDLELLWVEGLGVDHIVIDKVFVVRAFIRVVMVINEDNICAVHLWNWVVLSVLGENRTVGELVEVKFGEEIIAFDRDSIESVAPFGAFALFINDLGLFVTVWTVFWQLVVVDNWLRNWLLCVVVLLGF